LTFDVQYTDGGQREHPVALDHTGLRGEARVPQRACDHELVETVAVEVVDTACDEVAEVVAEPAGDSAIASRSHRSRSRELPLSSGVNPVYANELGRTRRGSR
jgi:hypothetical protein